MFIPLNLLSGLIGLAVEEYLGRGALFHFGGVPFFSRSLRH
jgi:hypothetical protein